MKVTVKVEGFKELEAALKDLSRSTNKRVAQKALIKAGDQIAAAAQALAPVEEGALKRTIQVSTRAKKTSSAGALAWGEAMRAGLGKEAAVQAARNANRGAKKKSEVLVYVGMNHRVGQGLLQEFGTEHHSAQPFMRPAWEAEKNHALEIVKDELAIAIEKAVARHQRKLARRAR